MFVSKQRSQDIKRTQVLSAILQLLDSKTYLFREAYFLGYPKFTGICDLKPDQELTAFVGIDQRGEFTFCWGRSFFDRLLDDSQWSVGSTAIDRVSFVLAHETLHVVLRHITRASGKNPKIWNLAADLVVNHFCKWYSLVPLPGSVCLSDFPACWGLDPLAQTTEQIYEKLCQNMPKISVLFNPPSGFHDGWYSIPDEQKPSLDDKISSARRSAASKDLDADCEAGFEGSMNQSCGSLPGDSALGELREIFDRLEAARQVDWYKLLRYRIGSMYQPTVAERWDRLPNRLSAQYGRLILPSQRREFRKKGIRILVSVDASGSMQDADVERMRAVCRSLPKEYDVTFSTFDTKCHVVESLDTIYGGGGTSLFDVDRVAEEISADCIICLTDGYFGSTGKKLTHPEDWVFVIDGSTAGVPDESTVFKV